LPALTHAQHILTNLFLTTQRLARETANPQSHRDQMWLEARADFLAYYITGESEAVFPGGVPITLYKRNGERYETLVTTPRSLRQPTITSRDAIMPSRDASSYNSQILSSALFKMSENLGSQRTLEFIHWMDSLIGGEAIPDVDPLDPGNPEIVRSAIEHNLQRLGGLFRRWAREFGTEYERSIVGLILANRNI